MARRTYRLTSGQKRWIMVGVLLVVLGGAALVGWRAYRAGERARLIAEAVPPRPDLTGWPMELQVRIESAERRALQGPQPLWAAAELATLYHANGFLQPAADLYRVLHRVDRWNAHWPHRLGSILAGFGQLDEARPFLESTVRLAANHAPARLRLADALVKGGHGDEAVRHYEHVLRKDPRNGFAFVGLARIEIEAQRWEAARDRLQKGLEVDPDFAPAWDLLATVQERLGQKELAAAARARARAGTATREPADSWLEELLNDSYDVYQLRVAASTAMAARDTTAAHRYLERARSLNPQDATVWREMGQLAAHQGDYARARQLLEEATNLAPRDSDNWIGLLRILQAVGDQAAAGATLARGLALNPQSPTLQHERGLRLRQEGRWDESLSAFRESARLRPQEVSPHLEMASLYFRLGNMDEAEAALRRAQSLDPGHPVVLTTFALMAISHGNRDGAENWLRQAQAEDRVPRSDLDRLNRLFQETFGVSP